MNQAGTRNQYRYRVSDPHARGGCPLHTCWAPQVQVAEAHLDAHGPPGASASRNARVSCQSFPSALRGLALLGETEGSDSDSDEERGGP
jgi:hypothetical protein